MELHLTECTVFNVQNESLTLKIKNKYSTDFESLKSKCVLFAFTHFESHRSKSSLEEFYCDPYNYRDSLIELKYSIDTELHTGSLIDIILTVNNVWMSKKSFGPVCELKSWNTTTYEYNFVDSDSDSDIEIS